MKTGIARTIVVLGTFVCVASLFLPWVTSETRNGRQAYDGFSDSESTIPLVLVATLVILECRTKQSRSQQEALKLSLGILAAGCVTASLFGLGNAMIYGEKAVAHGPGSGQQFFLAGLATMALVPLVRLLWHGAGNSPQSTERAPGPPYRFWFVLGTTILFASLFLPLGRFPVSNHQHFLYAEGYIGGPLVALHASALALEFGRPSFDKIVTRANRQPFLCGTAASFALVFFLMFRVFAVMNWGALPFWGGQIIASGALVVRLVQLTRTKEGASGDGQVANEEKGDKA